MSGIAGASEHSVKDELEPECAKCGRKFGDIGRHGKKLSCLPFMQGFPRIGVVAWCSRQCVDEWKAIDGHLIKKIIDTTRELS